MLKTPIRFDKVSTKEQLEAAKLFAASFNHVIDDHTIHPIIRYSRGDKQVGYATFVKEPICFPNFHTNKEFCTDRDFLDVTQQLRSWACLSSISEQFPNGCFFVGLATDYPQHMKKIMEGLGFRNTKHEIWEFA